MQLGQLVLHSKNPKLLGSFFSELLDKSLVESEDGFELEDKLSFPFMFTQKSKGTRKPTDEYFFYLTNQMEIDELKQRISFFCYRNGIKEKAFKITESEARLEVVDFDGRKWIFTIAQ